MPDNISDAPYPIWVALAAGVVLIIMFLLLVWFFKIRTPKVDKTEQHSEEWWEARREERRIELDLKEHTEKFIERFGFNPKLLSENRHQKEILLQLSLLATELMRNAKEATEYPSYREVYKKLSEEYANGLELIGFFDSNFQKQIPHWTELPEFVAGWLKGEKYRSPKKGTMVDCP